MKDIGVFIIHVLATYISRDSWWKYTCKSVDFTFHAHCFYPDRTQITVEWTLLLLV